MRILFCNTPYGSGGIGQHFSQLVDDSRKNAELDRYYAYTHPDGDSKGHLISRQTYGAFTYTPLRFFPALTTHLQNEWFDRRTARRLAADYSSLDGQSVMGFVGKSLRTFNVARGLGADLLELVAANSHVEHLARRHARAAADSGVHDSWLNDGQRQKTLREYALADRIYIHSEYVRQSFLDAGVPASKLVRTVLRPHPRFRPPDTRVSDGVFRIVYVGRLEMTKGIALLLEAFARLPVPSAELVLVGGWSSRAGRSYLQPRIESDPRIRLQPGDPLPHLQRADAFAHPSYEDGFGYAPMEALACGVPVIVTADTGMKEYVHDGHNGFVVDTGSVTALIDALDTLYRRPLTQTMSLLPSLVPAVS